MGDAGQAVGQGVQGLVLGATCGAVLVVERRRPCSSWKNTSYGLGPVHPAKINLSSSRQP